MRTHFHSFYHCWDRSGTHSRSPARQHFLTWLGQRINVLRVGMSQAFVIGWVSLCLVPLPCPFPISLTASTIQAELPKLNHTLMEEHLWSMSAVWLYALITITINKNNHASIGSSAIGTWSNTSVTLFRYHDYLSLLKGLNGTNNNQRFELAKRTYYGFQWSVADP